MGYLRVQTVKDRLEIVIVTPSADTLGLDNSELADFCQIRVVEIGSVKSIAQANAAGIRQASAPVVVLAEDHSFPDPHWAEALITAHRQPWAAVGPVVRNANPDSLISWADFLLAYGPWADSAPGGVIEHLPGHNSSYKRAILLEYDPKLGTMPEAESILHWDLQAKGHQLYLESAAKISHLNFGLLSSWIQAQFHSARVFAAARARQWSLLKRLCYTSGTPLIPWIRLQRILMQLRRSGHQHTLLPQVLPLLLLGLIISAAGEMMGYALGAGDTQQKLATLEFHRVRHLKKQVKEAATG